MNMYLFAGREPESEREYDCEIFADSRADALEQATEYFGPELSEITLIKSEVEAPWPVNEDDTPKSVSTVFRILGICNRTGKADVWNSGSFSYALDGKRQVWSIAGYSASECCQMTGWEIA